MKLRLIVGLFAILLVWSSVAVADEATDWRACSGHDWDQRIEGCTRLIQGGQRVFLANAHNNRGLIYVFKGDLEQAILDFDAAIKEKPRVPDYYFNRCMAFRDKGDLERALEDCDEAIRLSPEKALRPDFYAVRGSVYTKAGDYKSAIADLSKALRSDPDSAYIYAYRADAYRRAGADDLALADVDEALKLSPGDLVALTVRGMVFEHQGNEARARADLSAAVSASTNYSDEKSVQQEAREHLSSLSDGITVTPPNSEYDDKPHLISNQGKRVALVVGNSHYQNVAPLTNPANDARLMAETLRELGFKLVGDGPQLDLDKAAFDNAVQSFGNQLQGGDVGLFYYAGHGVQVRGSNYLVPISANPTKEADVDFQMLDANLVLRQMEGAGTKLNIVILDACRNNPFGGRGLRSATSGLAQMQAPEGTLISFATQPGNVAQDGTDGDSPYTEALAQTIKHPGTRHLPDFQRGRPCRREQNRWCPATLGLALAD